MPASLRKACHACAASKRRCIPQLPQCERCAERGLHCTYDLEPVTNTELQTCHHVAADSRVVFPQAWEPTPAAIFDSVASAHQAAIESYASPGSENLPVMANPETLQLVTEHYLRPMLQLTWQQKTTPFVHSQVLRAAGQVSEHLIPSGIAGAQTPPNFLALKEMQRQLLLLDIHSLSFTEFMAAFHVLISVLFDLVLNPDKSSSQHTLPQDLVGAWQIWRENMYTKLPQTLGSELSPWQAWCTAESARRSLLCIILVDGMMELAQKGYCSYRPLVESLPFDARTGLWEAETEGDWLAAVSEHGEAQSNLISWAEFIEIGGPGPRLRYHGVLQNMLLVIHFGKAAADLQNNLSSYEQEHGNTFRNKGNKGSKALG